MELHGIDILLFYDGGEIRTVVRERDGFAIASGGGEGMSEIKIGASREAFEKARRPGRSKLVPSHVRELHSRGKGTNRAGEKFEASEFRSFFTGLVERLQAQADAEKRNTSLDGVEQRCAESALIQRT